MKRKTYLEKAQDIVDELNSMYELGGTFSIFHIEPWVIIMFHTKRGTKVRISEYVTGKEAWTIMCAIGNYIDAATCIPKKL